jgi:hypothetical protein
MFSSTIFKELLLSKEVLAWAGGNLLVSILPEGRVLHAFRELEG